MGLEQSTSREGPRSQTVDLLDNIALDKQRGCLSLLDSNCCKGKAKQSGAGETEDKRVCPIDYLLLAYVDDQ